MKTVDWTENTPWDEILKQGEREEVVILRQGHAVALLTPFDDNEMNWLAAESDPTFIRSIAEARQEVKEGKTISHADLMSELGIDRPE